MDLLLDSHVLVWSIAADPRLPRDVSAAIEDSANKRTAEVIEAHEAEERELEAMRMEGEQEELGAETIV